MTLQEIISYLEWRFRTYNSNGYLKYMREWIKNFSENPQAYNLDYFRDEMMRNPDL